MRILVAVFAALCASCSRPVEINVVEDHGTAFATIRPTGTHCECNGGFAPVGECTASTDAVLACHCDDGGVVTGCVDAVHVEQDGKRVDLDMATIGEEGAAVARFDSDATFVFEGCGAPLRVPLHVDDQAPVRAAGTLSSSAGNATLQLHSDASVAQVCSGGGYGRMCCGGLGTGGVPVATRGDGDACGLQDSVQLLTRVDDVATSTASAHLFATAEDDAFAAQDLPCIPDDDHGLLACPVCDGAARIGDAPQVVAHIAFDPADAAHVTLSGDVTIDVRDGAIAVTGASSALLFGANHDGTASGSASGAAQSGAVSLGTFADSEIALAPIDVVFVDDHDATLVTTATVSFDVFAPPVALDSGP
ncbi:MAG TPA: hypothetical protein VGO62_12440 [Myxococcota bacterium]|jgi:hypothetical protein